jgi:hypothetical protein
MTEIIEHGCIDCMYEVLYDGNQYVCDLNQKKIKDRNSFPNFCPLDNINEGDEMINECIVCGCKIYKGNGLSMYCSKHRPTNPLTCFVNDEEYQKLKERIKKDNVNQTEFVKMCVRKELGLVGNKLGENDG